MSCSALLGRKTQAEGNEVSRSWVRRGGGLRIRYIELRKESWAGEQGAQSSWKASEGWQDAVPCPKWILVESLGKTRSAATFCGCAHHLSVWAGEDLDHVDTMNLFGLAQPMFWGFKNYLPVSHK